MKSNIEKLIESIENRCDYNFIAHNYNDFSQQEFKDMLLEYSYALYVLLDRKMNYTYQELIDCLSEYVD